MVDIAIVGEAYGEEEERQQSPFVGYSGRELTAMLDEAGIHRADCLLTNVFNIHPPGNKVEWFCGPKAEAIEGYPALTKGKHVRAEFSSELTRLSEELISANPNVVIALGNTAMWALLGKTAITKFRGTTDVSTHTASGFKVLPTYHPAAVCRQWELRPTTIIDLMKAARESKFPEVRRPRRDIWIEPSLEDFQRFYEEYIIGCPLLSVDIENPGGPIHEIGFGPRPDLGIVVPFYDERKKDRCYWRTQAEEIGALKLVAKILTDRKIKKLFQNGMYDVAVIWRYWNIPTFGFEEDTMLLSHSLQPEALKGLGYLGSLFADEGPWKSERKFKTFKKDD